MLRRRYRISRPSGTGCAVPASTLRHTGGVIPARRLRLRLPWFLLALGLVIARTADAHAHLCFDGQEPPASIHLADDCNHPCESGTSSGHSDDRDVELSGDALVKKAQPAEAWLPPAATVVTGFVACLSVDRVFLPSPDEPVPAFFLRPPSRGPPA